MTTLRLRNLINLPSARRLFLLAGLLAGMLAIMGTSPASAADLVAIAVTPNNPTVQPGFSVQFQAYGVYSDGSTQDLTEAATWSSSANSVATISNVFSSKGVATGLSPGSTQISAQKDSVSGSTTLTVQPNYSVQVQQPINADGTSVFNVKRGVVPVKFTLTLDGVATCALPPAAIALTRTDGGTTGQVDESIYVMAADNGSNFRIDSCQYIYNLGASALGVGTYRVDIMINGQFVGSAIFQLK